MHAYTVASWAMGLGSRILYSPLFSIIFIIQYLSWCLLVGVPGGVACGGRGSFVRQAFNNTMLTVNVPDIHVMYERKTLWQSNKYLYWYRYAHDVVLVAVLVFVRTIGEICEYRRRLSPLVCFTKEMWRMD